MCLIFHRTQKPYRLTASVDIPILKVACISFENNLLSPYMNSKIVLGVTYKTALDNPSKDGCSVGGLDDSRLKEKFEEVFYKLKSNASFVSKGFHAYVDMPINSDYNNLINGVIASYDDRKVLLKGYIPKGSKYYVNTITGMIVANSMVYTEIIKQ